MGPLGNVEWWPNWEAYDWFVDQVWQHIKGDRELHIFGAHSITLRGVSRTTLHRFVDELGDVLQGVDLMVKPIVSGSGVNVRVAEAIYNGMPMLCTPMAVAGLLAKPDPAIAVLERAEQWISVLGGMTLLFWRNENLKPQRVCTSKAGTHATSFATFLDRVITQVESSGNVNPR